MTTLGVVYDKFLSPYFAGGGAVHAYEVTIRLKEHFKIVYYPSSPVLSWDKENVEKKAKELESQGIKVADEFYEILEEKRRIGRLKRFLFADKIAREFSKGFKVDADILYEPDHTSLDIFYLARDTKYGVTFHEPPFYNNSLRYFRRLVKFYGVNPYTGKGFHTRFLYNEYIKYLYKRLFKKVKKPTFLAGVSEAPLLESGLGGEVIKPGNAFNPSLLKFRNRGKEDYVVFLSRLNQDKGFHELPDILRIMEKRGGNKVRLILMGKFFDKYNERRFWSKVRKYDLRVDYKGFVKREELADIVSKAKVLIYPSHVDGFSLVALESLALGTPVVAYDIPAIKSVYGGLECVRIVNEFDKESMAENALKFYKMSEKEIEEIMNGDKLMEFLKLHSNWDNVANSVLKILKKYLI
ncbi:glycosyltransferase [Saccharolobus solfataricus]|uniref:Glycosyltransferase n=1 Tax=Saccharolobus solfataricus TaxID=2287 RepID=A0A7S9NS03_SACSO|nr:glycosyltransferase [Saccharolobus solfataricus]QPG50683.1 glycosyltransferase [Saccharolobus solfataricus]